MSDDVKFEDIYPPGPDSPWLNFLFARMRVLAYLREDGQSVEEMMHAVNVDPGQVQLLLMTWDDAIAKKRAAATPPMTPATGKEGR